MGYGTILGGGNFAESFSALQAAAARPRFELQFNILQNSLLDQLSVKIDDLQSNNVNRVDEFLTLEHRKLSRAYAHVGKFGNDTQHNDDVLNEIISKFDTLSDSVTNSDDASFDSAISEIDDLMINSFKNVSGAAAGLNIKDGLSQYLDSGSGIGTYASYADDTERSAAVSDLLSNLVISLQVLDINKDTAYNLSAEISSRLTSIDIQVNADQLANEAELMETIEKMRDEHSQFLTYLSIGFEVAQSNIDQLVAALSTSNTQKGTVVDIIS